MRAVTFRKYGSIKALKVEQVEKPIPKPDEVLVSVMYTTVNRTDCGIIFARPWFVRLVYGLTKPKYPIPGTDFAGIVKEVGSEVKSFKEGDRVWGFDDSGTLGSYAEYLTIGEDKGIFTVPDNVSMEDAAASAEGAHYAFNFLNKFEAHHGTRVLVNGVTGAIGSAILQFCLHEKFEVTAVGPSSHQDWAKEKGARKVYDFESEDFTQDEDRYDYILDGVGKSSFGKCKHLLTENGIYISSELGPNMENVWRPLIPAKKKAKLAVPTTVRDSLVYIRERLENGEFRPLIDRSYIMKDIAQAVAYADSGKKLGNVLLKVAES